MIALGLMGLVAAYLLLYSGFKGTDPRDEITAALRGGKATPKLKTPGIGSTVPAPDSGAGTVKQPVGSMGYQVITTVAGHHSRPLGNWESDNAIDVVPSPNLGRGTPVHAVESGQIGLAFGYDPTGGYRIHLNVLTNEFYYAHFVGYGPGIIPGRHVNQGDVIGYMGDTGNAKGTPHVHFGARVGDPMAWADRIF